MTLTTTPLIGAGDCLLVASHNRGKVAEIVAMLAPYGLTVTSAAEAGLAEPEETGSTFEENALIKARAAAEASGLAALADDSGLEVAALGGAPGIYSARWGGEARDFGVAMARVEKELAAVGAMSPEKRGARFVAVLALVVPGRGERVWRGTVDGRIVWPPRGDKGHGYDPIFVPEGESRSFGEMEQKEKEGIEAPLSHRARAFAAFSRDILAGLGR